MSVCRLHNIHCMYILAVQFFFFRGSYLSPLLTFIALFTRKSSIFSRSEILRSIERWIDHERSSHFGNPFIFALCSFLFPISRLALIRHRDHGHEFLVVQHILPRDHGDHPAQLESTVVAVIFGLTFLLFVFYFIFLSPFRFALFY